MVFVGNEINKILQSLALRLSRSLTFLETW